MNFALISPQKIKVANMVFSVLNFEDIFIFLYILE